jgi:hypothetical protein
MADALCGESRGPPGWRKTRRWLAAGSCPGLGERGVPFLTVGDDVQQALGERHVVGVAGGDRLPRVAGRVGGRDAQAGQEPGFSVGAVVGEGFAGPSAGNQQPGSARSLTRPAANHGTSSYRETSDAR